MGRIKSALEIALERTENVKYDKGSIDQYDAKQKGKKLANSYLANASDAGINLADEIKKTPAEQRESLKQGIFDIFISQITLPSDSGDEKRLKAIGSGLQAIIANRGLAALYQNLTQALSQFLQEASHYDQAIRQQYAPRLRQKEEELSRRMGREVRMDPFQDPEFVSVYNQNLNALKGNYQSAIDQVKEEIKLMFSQP